MRKYVSEKEFKAAMEADNFEVMAAHMTQNVMGLIQELLIQKQVGVLGGIKEGLQVVVDGQKAEIALWKDRYSQLMTEYTCVLQGELWRGGGYLNNDPTYEKFRKWRDE